MGRPGRGAKGSHCSATGVEAGVTGVGLWREDVQAYGVEKSAALMRDAGLADAEDAVEE